MKVPQYWNPANRPWQIEFLKAMHGGARQAVLVVARRGGKDSSCWGYAIQKCVASTMNVVIIWPSKTQGFNNFWTMSNNDGRLPLDEIPKELIAASSNTKDDMSVTFVNGSRIVLLGTSDVNAARGANAKLYIFSEFVDIPQGTLGAIRPITALNGGQIILQSTPKQDGISGGTFKRLYEYAKKDPNQFTNYIQGHHFMTKQQMEQLKSDYFAEYGNDFLYRQEVLLDWGQSSQTSYYGEILRKKEKDGTMASYPYDDKYPVYTAWDLGISDSTAITFFQMKDDIPYIIDSYETNNLQLSSIVKFVQSKPYTYGHHFFPHDGARRNDDLVSRINLIIEMGLVNSSLLRREAREDGISRVAEGLPKTRINRPMCSELIRKLYIYKRKFNAFTGNYEGHDHSSESDIADSVRYMFTAIDQMFNKKGEYLYSPSKTSYTYESDLATVTFY